VLNGATDVALTFADYIDSRNRNATDFDQLTQQTKDFIAQIETATNIPVSLISKGFKGHSLIDRRNW
jgi:adenylosuccinate synthase